MKRGTAEPSLFFLTNPVNTHSIELKIVNILAFLPEEAVGMELNRAVAENIKRIRKSKKLSL